MGNNSEKYLERYLREKIELWGGVCWKWVSPGTNGVPDRIIFMPDGKMYLVELKSEGQKPSKLQLAVHRILEKLGFKVYVIDNFDDLVKFLNEIRPT